MPNFAVPNTIQMKKILFLCAAALIMTACGQKEQQEQEQEQPEEKQVFIPQGVPVAPMQEIQIQNKGDFDATALGDPNGPVSTSVSCKVVGCRLESV